MIPDEHIKCYVHVSMYNLKKETKWMIFLKEIDKTIMTARDFNTLSKKCGRWEEREGTQTIPLAYRWDIYILDISIS